MRYKTLFLVILTLSVALTGLAVTGWLLWPRSHLDQELGKDRPEKVGPQEAPFKTSLEEDLETLCEKGAKWRLDIKHKDGITFELYFYKTSNQVLGGSLVYNGNGSRVPKDHFMRAKNNTFGFTFKLEEKSGKRYIIVEGASVDPVWPYKLEGDALQLQGGQFEPSNGQLPDERHWLSEVKGAWKRVRPDWVEPIVIPKIPHSDPMKIRIDGDLGDWRDIPTCYSRIQAFELGFDAGTVQLAHDGTSLFLAYRVFDSTPLQNKAQDERAYFAEGDCVELRIGPFRERIQTDPIAGDVRLLFVPTKPDPSSILYRAVAPGAQEKDKVKLGMTVFDSVAKMSGVELVFKLAPQGYVCEARVPLKSLGISYSPGLNLRGDFGILLSDPAGGQTTWMRGNLFNKSGPMIGDLSEEAKLRPELWGPIVLE
jgi:hypothetical protein